MNQENVGYQKSRKSEKTGNTKKKTIEIRKSWKKKIKLKGVKKKVGHQNVRILKKQEIRKCR